MNFSRLISISAAVLCVCATPLVAAAQEDTSASIGANAAVAARDVTLARKRLAASQQTPGAMATGSPAPTGGTAVGNGAPVTTGGSPAPAAAPAVAPANGGTPLPEITEGDVSKPGFLGDRFTYEADLSSMYSSGTTNTKSNLPGGLDASLIYKLSRTTRAAAYYYQFSAYPLGADDNIPIFFQGTRTPIASVNGNAIGIDSGTHLRFQIYALQQMFFVGGKHHPLVFAPVYASIRSSIAGKDDTGTLFANNQVLTVHQRSYENKGLNLAIPLFYAENYLISYTGGVTWNLNMNGANLTNHPQYTQSLYTQYQPDEATTFFLSGAKTITYFPTDSYPYHSPTVHMGVSRSFAKHFFFEGEVSTGGPSNPNYGYTNGRIGIPNFVVPCKGTAAGGAPTLTCVALANNGVIVPLVGAQRYTTFTLMFGIGTPPLVRPF